MTCNMNIACYHTRGVFELLPTISITQCVSEKLGLTDWSVIFGWGTINFEISWETKF